MIEAIKQAIVFRFAPAINFNAPYANVMLDMSVEDITNILKEKFIEAMAHEGVEVKMRQQIIKRLMK